MYTPAHPSFTIYKVGCKGVYITQTCYHDVFAAHLALEFQGAQIGGQFRNVKFSCFA